MPQTFTPSASQESHTDRAVGCFWNTPTPPVILFLPLSLSLCTWPPFWGFDNYEWQEVGNGLNNDAEVDYYFWLLYHIWNHLGRPFLFLFLLCSDPSPHVTWQCDYIDIVSYSLMHPRLHGSWCLSKLLNQQSRRTVSDVCFLFLCEGILISCLKWWC